MSSPSFLDRTLNRSRSLFTEERGDVPGWVLITLMTAGLVLLIWGVAGPALTQVFEQAIDRVSGI
ncbi:hypothetical protein EAO79_11440 [Plantibacter sp. PA-3-X8]|uniref:hypothetical protein n=1 Tax=Plantibacter sp. PA-3-X8 TaxID=2480625 RepID=UPI000F5D5A67|nr:hypothetical protein [Plantibacter sp. PA-3-X8]AZH83447.1 hypothetical protein EAO79_11440 [Plantibacter sp. PA-3-X8]